MRKLLLFIGEEVAPTITTHVLIVGQILGDSGVILIGTFMYLFQAPISYLLCSISSIFVYIICVLALCRLISLKLGV